MIMRVILKKSRYFFVFLLILFIQETIISQSILEPIIYNKTTVTEDAENVSHFQFSDKAMFKKLSSTDNPTIPILYDGITKNLILKKTNILSQDYKLFTSDGETGGNGTEYTFYHGYVQGQPNSLVSMMYYDKKVHIGIFDKDGNYEINPFDGAIHAGYYGENHSQKQLEEWACQLVEGETSTSENQKTLSPGPNDCISIFIEVDHNMYGKKGSSVPNTEAWTLNLMNQIAILFIEQDVPINVSGIQVWDVPDPYVTAANTSEALGLFRNAVQNNPNNNGRLAHLLSGRSLGGGIAYLNTLCSTVYNVAVSANLNGGVVSYPNYSWNVMVVAHELGHNVGSNHTQACAWNGNNTAIDGCYTTEGSCPQPPIPYGTGGTVMSYCHLTSAGINLANGFGPQPGGVINSRYINATCVTGQNCTVVPPFNDVCNRAKEMPILKYCIEAEFYNGGTTASGDGGNMSCGATGTEDDMWYRFTFPNIDTVTLEFMGSTGINDLIVEIYEGTCTSLVSIACDSTENGNTIVHKLYDASLVGKELFIRVAEDGSDAVGDFTLCIYSDEISCGSDLDTLVNIYNSLQGSSWTNKQGWDLASMGDCNYCSWYGITCDFTGTITGIDLSSNNLSGGIIEDFKSIQALQLLNLKDNNLSDTIPNFWDSLDQMIYLDLSENQLTQEIPVSFTTMKLINTIYIDNNLLTGEIPAYLGYNSSLYSFSASNNDLSGCFPIGTNSLCYRDSLNLSGNPNMAFGGDVSGLCTNSAGLDYDQDGHCNMIDDCNDYDPNVNESAPEVLCDGIDNNCDGAIDEGSNFGPNIWAGLDTLGNWKDSTNWSLGYPPKMCQLVEIGTNGDEIHLSLQGVQYENFAVRGLIIGSNTTFHLDTTIRLNISGGGTLVNDGIILVDGRIIIDDQQGTSNTAVLNSGVLNVRSAGSLNIYQIGEYGIHNLASGYMSFEGYSYIQSAEFNTATTAISAIRNVGLIEIFLNLYIYGDFLGDHVLIEDGSTIKVHDGGQLTTQY